MLRELHLKDRLLDRALPAQTLKENKLYVKSRFVLDYECGGRPCVFSTLTAQSFLLPFPLEDAAYPAARIAASEELTELMRGYFLVPEDMDESAFYLGISNMMKALHRKKKAASYTVLPTLACNARCFYCYEEGLEPITMSAETIEKTVEYIKKTHDPSQNAVIQWFGGEPLLRADIIEAIMDGLDREGVGFVSIIVTNGSLITPELARRMRERWRLERAQLSFDGAEEDYIRRRRYAKYDETYKKVLEAASLLSEQGVFVTLRCNVDKNNIGDIPRVIEDVKNLVKNRENFVMYFHPLDQALADESVREVQRAVDGSRELLEAAGIGTLPKLVPHTYFRTYRCMCDDPTRSIVILPDGGLCGCIQSTEGFVYGSVHEGVTKPEVLKRFLAAGPVREKCKGCTFLPSCTAFAYCPVVDPLCREKRMKTAMDYLPGMAAQVLERMERAEKAETGGEALASVNPEELDIMERLNTANEHGE